MYLSRLKFFAISLWSPLHAITEELRGVWNGGLHQANNRVNSSLTTSIGSLITKSKSDTTHSRRSVFSYLQNKDSVNELFGGISEKIADRPGGYTRIIKTGSRLGDNADMCIIELVDYNNLMLTDKPLKATKTRRRRKKTKTNKDVSLSSKKSLKSRPDK